jgi:hypothetical protein
MDNLKLIKSKDIDQTIISDDSLIKIEGTGGIYAKDSFKKDSSRLLIVTRASGEFKDHGFYLSPCVDWHLEKDSAGTVCLIPTRRKK